MSYQFKRQSATKLHPNMLIQQIEIRLLDLPLHQPFAAAHGTTSTREIVVVNVETDSGTGWGECSALPEPTYTSEFAVGAFVILEEELAPRLIGHDLDPHQIIDRLSVTYGNPMAKASLEMALLDAQLRSDGLSLASWIGAEVSDIEAGAVVGLGEMKSVMAEIGALVDDGFNRIKMKIKPGHDIKPVSAVVSMFPNVDIHVDGNGSFDDESLDLLVAMSSVGIGAIEQPFPIDRFDLAVKLIERASVPIVADEAATSPDAIALLVQKGAMSALAIKPPRIGGILTALHLHDLCIDWSIAATMGGMLETGLGRHCLAALGALPAFTLTGDVSPASRWLAADPWNDVEMINGRIIVPSVPGIAGTPDSELLDQFTTRRSVVELKPGQH